MVLDSLPQLVKHLRRRLVADRGEVPAPLPEDALEAIANGIESILESRPVCNAIMCRSQLAGQARDPAGNIVCARRGVPEDSLHVAETSLQWRGFRMLTQFFGGLDDCRGIASRRQAMCCAAEPVVFELKLLAEC